MIPRSVFKYLQTTGERQREIRLILSDSSVSAAQRKEVLLACEQMAMFFNGYFRALYQIYDEEKVEYAKQYYEQARSKQGLTFEDADKIPL